MTIARHAIARTRAKLGNLSESGCLLLPLVFLICLLAFVVLGAVYFVGLGLAIWTISRLSDDETVDFVLGGAVSVGWAFVMFWAIQKNGERL